MARQCQADFDEATRVGDGFALGMRSLALGRWYVGAGGLTLAQNGDPTAIAQQALAYLQQASRWFLNQGMDPWVLFSTVQQAKAYADLHRFDDAQEAMDLSLIHI